MTAQTPVYQQSPSGPVRRVVDKGDPLKSLRQAVYLYFLLWLFEGALRKWIAPGLSSPLLIVRDPILLYIYFLAIQRKVFRLNGYGVFMIILGTLSVIVSMGLFKAPPLKVIAFGIHANFIHLPLIFLLPEIINYAEVRKIGRIVMWLGPPMALIAAWQFLSPSGARINVGAGGEGKMIETALGRIRPSGTFSFTNGLAEYTVLLSAFFFHHLLEKKIFPKLAFLLAGPSILVLVLMSGSRTTFALVGLEVLTVIVIWIIKPRFMRSSIKLVAIGVAVFLIIGSVGALRVGMDVIVARFANSGGVKEGFIVRFFDEFKKPIAAAARAEPAGVGIGMGTNAASSMMYKMLRFNLGESEMDRIVMEMGPYLGLPYLLWRFAVLIYIVRVSLAALRERGNTLPLLLATACANDLVMGQFGQTTVLGYAVLASGFALSALQRRDDEGLTSYDAFESEVLPTAPDVAQLVQPAARMPVGSTYANRLRAEMEMDQPSGPVVTSGNSAIDVPKKTRRVRKPSAD